MAAIIRILGGNGTRADMRAVARLADTLPRRTLKDIAVALTGGEVYGLKAEIVEQVRELLA